jgi:hypothetical protein
MPMKQVPAEAFLTHNGVTVFHVYKNDDVDGCAREFWFSLSEFGSDDDGHEPDGCGTFDVRELKTWEAHKPGDDPYPDRDRIKAAIIDAIDQGELQTPSDEQLQGAAEAADIATPMPDTLRAATPGPWLIDGDSGVICFQHPEATPADPYKGIAKLMHEHTDPVDGERCAADAALMRSAREMYAALLQIACLEHGGGIAYTAHNLAVHALAAVNGPQPSPEYKPQAETFRCDCGTDYTEEEAAGTSWQQTQCPSCGSWNDR